MNRPAIARREIVGLVSGCPGVQQTMKGNAKAGLDVLDQRNQLRNNRMVAVIPVAG